MKNEEHLHSSEIENLDAESFMLKCLGVMFLSIGAAAVLIALVITLA